MYNIEFIKKALIFLEEIEENKDKKEWCSNYNVYKEGYNDVWQLGDSLYEFFRNVFNEGFVPKDYSATYETIGSENMYRRKPTSIEIASMSADQIVACIAKQFRNDHFDNGILISRYVAEGILYAYFNALYNKLEKEEAKAIKLNDILQFSNNDLKKAKIRFNQTSPDANPMDLYLKNPELVNSQWFLWKKKQGYFKEGQIAICLLKIAEDTWLLTTIKKIIKELNVTDNVNYEAEELSEYKKYYGRLIIRFHKTFQSQGIFLNNIVDELIVNQILPDTFNGFDFPGYDKVRLSFSELETIIHSNKKDWIAALENQKAVYLITDKNNGKLYIGSATSDTEMLLSRWKSYVKNGHGGNKELFELVENNGFDYVKNNFQYSIIENYNAKIDDHVILERESWWKEALKTRQFGYNSN